MRLGSAPTREGAIRSWMSASTAAQPNQLSPSPIRPSSVWTRTQISVGREVRRTVSILVIFIVHPITFSMGTEIAEALAPVDVSGRDPEGLADWADLIETIRRAARRSGGEIEPVA